MKLKRLSDSELRMNQQAATIAASVLCQPVEAATRCEQPTTTATQMYASGGGDVSWKRVPNGTGLPKSFVLAVTRSHVHALEDKHHRDDLVAGQVLKSWDRAGLRAQTGSDAMKADGAVPDDRQVLILWVPIDADSNRYAQELARQRAASGGRIPGVPQGFLVARDAPSQRVIDALAAAEVGRAAGGGPNIKIGAGANITIGGQRLQDMIAQAAAAAAVTPAAFTPPQLSAAQRLQELETLRATGAIAESEYTAKRQQIISEI
jgi:hypothetical protein